MDDFEKRELLVEIDVSGIHGSSDELHSRLADALNFPGYYGQNWDAFWDCMTSAPSPHKLIIYGLNDVTSRDYQELSKCLSDFKSERPEEACEYELHWEPSPRK